MRYIEKRLAHSGFLKLLQKENNKPKTTNGKQAGTRWEKFKGRKEVLQLLVYEQYGLCCYSELRCDIKHDIFDEPLFYHIEHVKNKSFCPEATFDYHNLLASAFKHRDVKKFPEHQIFGGHANGKIQLEPTNFGKFISPLVQDCHKFFMFRSDGEMVPCKCLCPEDIDKAQYTIDILKLNSPILKVLREKEWKRLERKFEMLNSEFGNKEGLLKAVIIWAKDELLPKKHRLGNFFSLKRQFFHQCLGFEIMENILQGYKNGILK